MADDGDWILVKSKNAKHREKVHDIPLKRSSTNEKPTLHQDYNQIVFRKPITEKKLQSNVKTSIEPVRKPTYNNKVGMSASLNPSFIKKIEKKADDGNLHFDTISHEIRLKIQQGRIAKQWSQAELAKQCNFPTSVIRDYESGKAIKNTSELGIISHVLGIKLK